MGMSAADAPLATKASIIVAATTQPAIFNPHLAAMNKPSLAGRDVGMAEALGVGKKSLPEPARFEERQESSMVSLMGPELEISRTAQPP
jgi:hypothetical protein